MAALAAMLTLALGQVSTPAPAMRMMPELQEEVAVFDTSAGKFVLMFYPEISPKHVENFKSLVGEGFYNGTRFHRCIPGFVIQGGDPFSADLAKANEWGTGGKMVDGKERTVPAEFNLKLSHTRGVLSMARSEDPNSASSQFFVCVADVVRLDNKYSTFGRVVKGMEVVDAIVATGPADRAQNGKVPTEKAVVVNSAKLMKWEAAK